MLNWGISHKLHLMEKPPTKLPAFHTELPICTVVSPSTWPLQRNSWNCISTNRIETFPIQLELHSYILISISTDQSEWLHSNQSGQSLMDQSNCGDLEPSFVWGLTNQGPGMETSHCLSQLPSGSQWAFLLSIIEDCVYLDGTLTSAGSVTPEWSYLPRTEL